MFFPSRSTYLEGTKVSKATFTIGVFGLACWNDKGILRIKVNERTDQARQKKIAGLPEDCPVKIIDMPGGGVEISDFPDPKQASLWTVLEREIAEETGGCKIDSGGPFSEPFMVVTNNQDDNKPTGDIAFWMPVVLHGKPLPTSEAQNHPWITLQQLDAETEFRAVGGLGKAGRTGSMIRAAFCWYAERCYDLNLFSKPE